MKIIKLQNFQSFSAFFSNENERVGQNANSSPWQLNEIT